MKRTIYLLLVVALLAATTVSAKEIQSRTLISSDYPALIANLGIGDRIFEIVYTDGTVSYKLERSTILKLASIISNTGSKTINIGESASIDYTVKGSGSDGFDSHTHRFVWYDKSNGMKIIDSKTDYISVGEQKTYTEFLGTFQNAGTFSYSIVEEIDVNIKYTIFPPPGKPNCPIHETCYKTVTATGDTFDIDIIVKAKYTPKPTPTSKVTSTPTPAPTITGTAKPTSTATSTPSPTPTGTVTATAEAGSTGGITYECKEGMILTENGCKYPTGGGGTGTPPEVSIMDNPLYIYVGLFVILGAGLAYALSPKKGNGKKKK